MFFPEKITGIEDPHRVLEIGPGSLPYHRADIFLDIKDDEHALEQRGGAEEIQLEKPIVYYDGGRFPFKDNEFDYVIASHVIEHVPIEDLAVFVSELQRVAPRGYIEFPNVFYEFICHTVVHKTFMNFRGGEMIFLDKNVFKSNWIHKAYRELFYCRKTAFDRAFNDYKSFFFVGFEWNRNEIKYRVVNDFDSLVSEDEFNHIKNYFQKDVFIVPSKPKKPMYIKVLKQIKRTFS